jgi:hypothetical protein
MSDTTKINALLVGRHTPDLGAEAENWNIVGTENVMFSLKKAEAIAQLYQLEKKAATLDAKVILFQNTPTVVTAALLQMQRDAGNHLGFQYAAVVSIPGPREADVVATFEFTTSDIGCQPNGWVTGTAEAAVKFANGRARVAVEGDILTVTVDPVTKFVFSHIEWLS